VKSYIDNGGTFQWVGPVGCRYDALNRQTRTCASDEVGGRAAFDGDNVVRVGGNWRFVHGPEVDDPLVGLYWWSPNWLKFFYLTDGRGRLLAFTDAQGNDYLDHVTYTQNGGNRAGAIDRSHTFANSRAETAQAPNLSFYRNRYYDQTTGRWTQEDPIGIAGGVNLYQYVGNNPATFTDPFGLREGCPPDCPLPPVRLSGAPTPLANRVWVGTPAGTMARAIGEKIESSPVGVGMSGSFINASQGCGTGRGSTGCSSPTALVGAPVVGASVDVTVPNPVGSGQADGEEPSVTIGFGRHSGVTIAPSTITFNIGVSVGGSRVTGNVPLPAPSQGVRPGTIEQPSDATRVRIRP
jgi:RHS repeat-associated protein